jgi:hypothetical protein
MGKLSAVAVHLFERSCQEQSLGLGLAKQNSFFGTIGTGNPTFVAAGTLPSRGRLLRCPAMLLTTIRVSMQLTDFGAAVSTTADTEGILHYAKCKIHFFWCQPFSIFFQKKSSASFAPRK